VVDLSSWCFFASTLQPNKKISGGAQKRQESRKIDVKMEVSLTDNFKWKHGKEKVR